jgi:hypothetical protein
MANLERHVEWTSPAALWDHVGATAGEANRRLFRTPAILRFASDTFMQELIDLVNVDPHRMSELLAVPETWSAPPATAAPAAPASGVRLALQRARTAAIRRIEARSGAVSRAESWNVPPAAKPLKLYHPANLRYYLVAASLVCRKLGLPDRHLDASKQEKASFVIRMLEPATPGAVNPDPNACSELALVKGTWQRVTERATLVAGEEQHSLSPLAYVETDGRRRRLFNGFIPVGKRESLAGARRASSTEVPIGPREMLLKSQVFGPWAAIESIAETANAALELSNGHPTLGEKKSILDAANEQIQFVSWYVLLDFRKWLGTYLPDVLSTIDGQSPALSASEQAVLDELASIVRGGITLRSALRDIAESEPALEQATEAYPKGMTAWPSLLFRFVDATGAAVPNGKPMRESLENKIVAALPAQALTLPHRIAAVAHANPAESPWFTIRCVFERPNCATLSPPVVSDPSAAFQFAAFFDPDAPARPIRIGLPTDTTPAGLRKFDKNTAFVMSDVLCGQFGQASSKTFGDLVRSVLPWPFHKDFSAGAPLPGPCKDGMICSFSIPIITIVALILLMIFVKLLDIIFFWMPFFQVCLPLPGLNAKKVS